MATKKNAAKTEATTTNDMIDAGAGANAPATNPTAANQVIASDFGSDERSAQRLKKAAKKVAAAPTPEPEVVNTMVEGGLATDFRSDEERAKSTRRKQAKAIVASVSAATAAENETPAVVAQPIAKKARKTKVTQVMPGDATLSRVADHYLKHLEERGAGAGTIASYGMELKTAMAELGADTRIADLTPDRVQTFFDCARVTLLRNGKEKSPLSIAKTRRVLRLALYFAQDKKLIENAPVPEKSPAA